MVCIKGIFKVFALKRKSMVFLNSLIKINIKTIVSTVFIMLVISSGAQINAEENSAQINLRDVEIPTLVDMVSRITGKSFVVDPRVKGRVTVITSKDISEDELYETFLSILQVHGFSAVPSGANLIKIVPSNQAKQQPVPFVGDDGKKETVVTTTKYVSKPVSDADFKALYEQYANGGKKGSKPVKPTKRTTVKKVVNTVIKKTNPKADELITRVIRVEHVPAAMLVPILRPLVPSTGQLQAYGPSNTIVISDRAANIERLVKVIKRMDRVDDEELEVVPLKFASAKTLAQTIQKLQQSGIKGVRGKNKVAADERTNSLLLSGDRSARQQVKKIIRKLDTYEKIEEKTKVVYLRYAKAEELAKVLTGFSKTQASNKPVKKGAAGSKRKPGIDIQADAATNSLIITADPDVHKNLVKVIRKLDVRRAQVLVEAVIAEIDVNLTKRLGVSLGVLSSDGVLGATGSSVTGLNTLLGLLGSTTLPTSAPDGGTFGLMDNQGGGRFGALIQALLSDGATNILSTPTVIAMDNEEASLIIGENVPFVTGSQSNNSTGGNPFTTIEREDIGIKLKIKPQINAGDSIRLEIEQEVSSLGASSTAAERITNKRLIKTSVMVADDQVLILGGLMEDSFTDTVTKVPGLGNLPVVGKLFSSTTTIKGKKNLMVFIHPVIMRDVLSADSYTRQKYNKLRHIQHKSGVDKRGILKEKPDLFPNDLKNTFVKKMTPQQLKQQQRRQQQYNRQRQIQARSARPRSNVNKMSQQQRAAQQQSQYRAPKRQAPQAVNRATLQQNAAKQRAFGSRTSITQKKQAAPRAAAPSKVQPSQQQQVDDFLDGIQ